MVEVGCGRLDCGFGWRRFVFGVVVSSVRRRGSTRDRRVDVLMTDDGPRVERYETPIYAVAAGVLRL